jgi:hypothetical protein
LLLFIFDQKCNITALFKFLSNGTFFWNGGSTSIYFPNRPYFFWQNLAKSGQLFSESWFSGKMHLGYKMQKLAF